MEAFRSGLVLAAILAPFLIANLIRRTLRRRPVWRDVPAHVVGGIMPYAALMVLGQTRGEVEREMRFDGLAGEAKTIWDSMSTPELLELGAKSWAAYADPRMQAKTAEIKASFRVGTGNPKLP